MEKAGVKNEYAEELERNKNVILDIINLTERGYLEWYIETTNFTELLESFRHRENGLEELLRSSMLGLSSKFIAVMPKGQYVTIDFSECISHTCLRLRVCHTDGKHEHHITAMETGAEMLFLQLISRIRNSIMLRNLGEPRNKIIYYKEESERKKEDDAT